MREREKGIVASGGRRQRLNPKEVGVVLSWHAVGLQGRSVKGGVSAGRDE